MVRHHIHSSDRIGSCLCRCGFTLIELLVVVAIIVLLLSILLPSLGRARAQSRQVACLNNMRQVALLTQFYAADNNGMAPIRGTVVNGGVVAAWPYLLWPYAKKSQEAPPAKSYKPDLYWKNTVFNCPEQIQVNGIARGSDLGLIYAMNTWLKTPVDNQCILQRANVCMRLYSQGRSDIFLYVEHASNDSTVAYTWSHYTINSLQHSATRLPNSHMGNTNAVFVDGHAEYMRKPDWPHTATGDYAYEAYNVRWTGGY